MLLALLGCCTIAPVRADPSFERVGIGAAIASPVPSLSLSGQLDDRWSGALSFGFGAELRASYTPEGARDRYWTFGTGYAAGTGVVHAGYGRTWRRGPWRWHVEALLNLPVYIDRDDCTGGLATATTAALTFLVPVGFGVHYVFSER